MFEPELGEEDAEAVVPTLDLLLPRDAGVDTAVHLRVQLPPGDPLESPPNVQLVADNTLPTSATAAGQGAVADEVAVRLPQSPPAACTVSPDSMRRRQRLREAEETVKAELRAPG